MFLRSYVLVFFYHYVLAFLNSFTITVRVSQTNQSIEPIVLPYLIRKLRSIAVHSLARMYHPEERLFAFRLRKNGNGEALEGVSHRYTAMVLIGLAGESPEVVKEVLGKHSREDVCERLLQDIHQMNNLGDVAIITWAARAIGHARASEAIGALRRMEPGHRPYPTMDLSWALSALTAGGNDATDNSLADNIAEVLLASFNWESGVFRRWSQGCKVSRLRAHASCFADFVYPILALSHYHLATGNPKALETAVCCAEHMCQQQGEEGQWWWYYDARTGRVLEQYPVYAVHQDAMAPMALFALAKASGRSYNSAQDACARTPRPARDGVLGDYSESIEKGLHWLVNPAEVTESLIDMERYVIWRKVARREPRRIVRGLQAGLSCLHPRLGIPGVDALFPASSIDYETRPYHMGWILYAWSSNNETKSKMQISGLNNTRSLKDGH